jgi:hypothetical protein
VFANGYKKIFHYHLKKCGGTSLNYWLNNKVADHRFWDGLEPNPRSQKEGDATSSRDMPLATVIQGFFVNDLIHSHASWTAFTPPDTFRMTVLRDPVSRILSQVRDLRREAQVFLDGGQRHPLWLVNRTIELSLKDYLEEASNTPEVWQFFDNYQTRALAAIHPDDENWLSDASGLIDLALNNIDTAYDVIGVAENHNGARLEIARRLGFPPDHGDIEKLNVSSDHPASKISMEEIESARAILSRLTKADALVYAAALSNASNIAYTEADFERDHAIRVTEGLRPQQQGNHVWFSVKEPLVASGLQSRDGTGLPECRVWTGPSTRSVIYMPAPPGQELELCLQICGYAAPQIREQMYIEIDDCRIDHYFEGEPDQAEVCVVPATSQRPFVKLTIHTGQTADSIEGGQGPGDQRKRGISIDRYGWRIKA